MKYFIPFFIFAFSLPSIAQQRNLPKNFNTFNINASFGAQIPAADIAKRFGNNLGVGGGIEYVRIPSGWSYSLYTQYLFGQAVYEDVLSKIRTDRKSVV